MHIDFVKALQSFGQLSFCGLKKRLNFGDFYNRNIWMQFCGIVTIIVLNINYKFELYLKVRSNISEIQVSKDHKNWVLKVNNGF